MGNIRQVRKKGAHVAHTEWLKKYGPIFTVRIPDPHGGGKRTSTRVRGCMSCTRTRVGTDTRAQILQEMGC